MQKIWNAVVTSPLGQESYNLTVSKLDDDTYKAVGQEDRGKIDFKGFIKDGDLLLSGYTEFPMKVNLNLILKSFDLNSVNINGLLKIGNFCTVSITGAAQ